MDCGRKQVEDIYIYIHIYLSKWGKITSQVLIFEFNLLAYSKYISVIKLPMDIKFIFLYSAKQSLTL